MRPQRDVPPEWGDRMIKLGFHHNGRPSTRALAEAAGVTVNAALRVIFREGYGDATAIALGKAMRDPNFVANWLETDLGEDYSPPTESRHLTARQRGLVDDLIRELTSDRGGSNADAAPQKKSGELPESVRDDFTRAAMSRKEKPLGE